MEGYLFDTNIAIALLAGEPAVLEFVKKAKDDRMLIYFSVITECEVFSGLHSEYRIQGIKLFNSRRCIEVSSKIARLAGDNKKGAKIKRPQAQNTGCDYYSHFNRASAWSCNKGSRYEFCSENVRYTVNNNLVHIERNNGFKETSGLSYYQVNQSFWLVFFTGAL